MFAPSSCLNWVVNYLIPSIGISPRLEVQGSHGPVSKGFFSQITVVNVRRSRQSRKEAVGGRLAHSERRATASPTRAEGFAGIYSGHDGSCTASRVQRLNALAAVSASILT